jgi:hypothetical protein
MEDCVFEEVSAKDLRIKPISLFSEPPNRRAENTGEIKRCNDELRAHVFRLEEELQIVKHNYATEVDMYIQEMVRLTENLKAQEQLKGAADTQQAKAEANRSVETCKRLLQRILRQYLASAWACFKESIWTSKRNNTAMRRVLKRISHRSLALVFDGYSEAVSTMFSQREKVAKAIAQWTTPLPDLIRAFEAWVAYVDVTRQEQAKQEQELAQTRLMADQEYRSNAIIAKEAASAREKVDKVLKRMSHRSLVLAFEGYSEAVSTMISQRRSVTKAIAQWTLQGLTKAFEAWVEYVDVSRQEQEEESQKLAQTRLMADADLTGKASATPKGHSLPRCTGPGVGTSVIHARNRHRDTCIIVMMLMLLALAALAGFVACADLHITCQQHVLHVPCKERASEGWRKRLFGTILRSKGRASQGDAAHELEVLQEFDAQRMESEVRALQSQLQTSEKDYLAAHEQLEHELLACHHWAHRDESEIWALQRQLEIIDNDYLAPHEQIENELQACHHRLRGQEQVALYKRPEPLNPNASSTKPKPMIETKAQHEDVVAQLERRLQSTKDQLSTTQHKLGRSQEEGAHSAHLTETKAQQEEIIAQLEGELHTTKEQLSTILPDLSQTQDELEHSTRDLQEELAGKVESIGGLQEQLATTQSKLLVSQRELYGFLVVF